MIEEAKLEEILGTGNVIHDQTTLEEYSRDTSFVNPIKPEGIVKPGNADDVQKIVKLALKTKTPLVPVSSGHPHLKGDTVPATGGAYIVDLSGMKRIFRVDRPHRVAMCEPGVTFGELVPAAAKEGLRLNMPFLPKQSKSVVASMLEREPVVLPKYQWDISDPLACMGIVFGTGDDFRTGQAVGPGTLEEQWAVGAAQKVPYGPGPATIHRLYQAAQGTMGIATWASLRCEILPQIEDPYFVGSTHLDRLFDLSHWLIRLRYANECFILDNTTLSTIIAKNCAEDYQSLMNSLPPWILFYNIVGYDYYPEERMSYQVKAISKMSQRIGVESVRSITGISAREMLQVVQQPCEEPYWKLRHKGGCEEIAFLTNYDMLPDLLDTMNADAIKAGYPLTDMGVYIQPLVQGTSIHCEFNLFYDPENTQERDRIEALSTSATRHLMGRGAFFSRPYGPNAGMIMNKDAASLNALRKVKKIFDPENIMSPGKLCLS